MNMPKLSVWYRLLISISVIWILIVFIDVDPLRYARLWSKFLGAGILPVIIIWSILWVVNGITQVRKKNE